MTGFRSPLPAPHPRPRRSGGLLLLAFFAFAVFLLAALGGVAWLFLDTGPDDGMALFSKKVAVVRIHGPILGSTEWVDLLEECEEDDNVVAVVLDINSPGGGIAPTQKICEAVAEIKKLDKPVLASMGSVAASGGYYVACAADDIYAMPGTLTGSIGVYMQLMDLTELLDKAGVDFDFVKKGTYKTAGDFSKKIQKHERRMFQAVVDDFYAQFLEAVTECRMNNRVSMARGWNQVPPGGFPDDPEAEVDSFEGVVYPSASWGRETAPPSATGETSIATETVEAATSEEPDSTATADAEDRALEQFAETLSEEAVSERVATLAEGRIYTGRQAHAIGLVDELAGLADVIKAAGERVGLGDDPRVVYKEPGDDEGFFGSLKVRAGLAEGPRFLYWCPYAY